MFHRDPGAEEDLTSDPTFAWPPSGFRDRRSHFGRTDPTATASASSSSSPFGHSTAQRKSSDQVIQSLRDELDKHRQMFFDRLAPQWESTAQRVSVVYELLSFVYFLHQTGISNASFKSTSSFILSLRFRCSSWP